MALEHRCDHYHYDTDLNNDSSDDDRMPSSKMDDVASVLAQQAESSLSITSLETREITKINPFAFAMPRQVHPGLYSSPPSSYHSPITATASSSTNSVIHGSSSSSTTTTTAATTIQTPAATPIKGVPGFPDFPWTEDFVVPGSSSSSHLPLSSGRVSGGPSSMVSSPQNNASSINSLTMTTKSSIFGHFVDEALTATPIRSNIGTVVSHNSSTVNAITASSSSSSTGATTTTSSDSNFEYNAMLLDLQRDNTKNAHKHNLRRLQKLRRQRVNHGSLKAASIIQSMPKPRHPTITASSPPIGESNEVSSKNINIDEQQQQQEQDGDQDMTGVVPSTTATSKPTTRWHQHHHQHHLHSSRRDDDTGCKVAVSVKKKTKRRASNKLWTKMQNRRTKQRAVKSFYVQEWKRNGPLLRPVEPSEADRGNCKSDDDPVKLAAMKKEKKRIKKKLKRDVVELSFDLNSLRV